MSNNLSGFLLIFCHIVLVFISLVSTSWEMVEVISTLFLMTSIFGFVKIIVDDHRGGVSYMVEFFMLFFIAIPAKVQIESQFFPWSAVLSPEHICIAFALISFSLIFYYLSLFKNGSRPNIKNEKYTLDGNSGLFYIKFAYVFALLSILFALVVGPSSLLTARFDLEHESLSGGLTLQFLSMARSLSLLAMLIFVLVSVKVTSFDVRKKAITCAFIFAFPFLIINYLPALPRFVLFGIFITLSVFFIDYFKMKNKLYTAAASFMLLLIVFPMAKMFSSSETSFSFQDLQLTGSGFTELMLNVDFDSFMQIVSSVEYFLSDATPIRYGMNFLGVILFIVPRGLWESKPLHTGDIVASELGYLYTNVSSPLPAEALLGFGIIGPALIFYYFGLVVSKIEYSSYDKNGKYKNPVFLNILYALLMGFVVIILRGALNSVAATFMTAFMALFFMEWFRIKYFKK